MLIAGRTAQEFNRRKKPRGDFWEDRYHATAVQTDSHLARCITYIDLNMVRARAIAHPCEWAVAGYNEIQDPWQRKGVIDFETLVALLDASSTGELARMQNRWLDAELGVSRRAPEWTESVAVGEEAFLADFKIMLGARGIHRELSSVGNGWVLRDRRWA
ncbi:MAG: hypothetical protein KJO76_02280 [Gammaproteobacteria bacterium]|nr:hypothetical protein [Gammaproteobacteria bacterium]NND36081.1 hypothetical protein [Gammaproteobacteria bacterium]